MKNLKYFEDYKKNNKMGDILEVSDIVKCIKDNGYIYANVVMDLEVDNIENIALKPVSVDNDGSVTIEYDGDVYEVELSNITKIFY